VTVLPAHRLTRRAMLVAGTALATGLAAAACASAPVATPQRDTDGLLVHGQADYEWPLVDLEGTAVSLAAHRGAVVFINMWATWCAPCVRELASIQALRDALAADGAGEDVRFLLVSPEDSETVRRFVQRHAYALPFYIEAAPLPRAFGLEALPTSYVVDRRGRIVLKHRGATEWNRPAVIAFLRALAQERATATPLLPASPGDAGAAPDGVGAYSRRRGPVTP
jgi:thiol-disulfide isomerase/thioredoxin